jgi:hypothetical protein
MRDKIRKWFVDNPRAMDAAYAMAAVGSMLITINEATGGNSGP